MNRQITWPLACLLLLPLAVHADEKGPPTYKLTAQPAAEPVPALKYHFIPSMLDQTPGNAAIFYLKAAMLQGISAQHHKNMESISEWLAQPVDKLPRQSVRKLLAEYKSPLHEVELGATKRAVAIGSCSCADGDPFSITLEEVQRAREWGRLLALRARLQIAEGKPDEAIATLRMAFVLAQHVGEQPTLVSGLVGLRIISSAVLDQVETLMQTPNAPNLYWALSMLPNPAIDFRAAVQFEMHGIELTFPELQDVETSSRTAEDWQAMLNALTRKITTLNELVGDKTISDRFADPAWQTKAEPAAKKYLVENGHAAEKVQAMSSSQALIVATKAHYRVVRDSLFRWFYVPYWQAQAGFKAAERALADDKPDFDLLPVRSFLPAMANVSFTSARLDRRIAALRILEALRIYAAAHQGQLPAQLERCYRRRHSVRPCVGPTLYLPGGWADRDRLRVRAGRHTARSRWAAV